VEGLLNGLANCGFELNGVNVIAMKNNNTLTPFYFYVILFCTENINAKANANTWLVVTFANWLYLALWVW